MFTGSRINTACQFGFVSMDMLNSTTSDSGEYTCLIRTDAGSVQSSCRLVVSQRIEIESEMHHSASLSATEQHHHHQQQQIVIQEEKVPPPKFTRKLQNLEGRMEGSSVKLEGQVTPTSDSSMKIEWFKDGRPITASSRISSMYSFGYVSLNISGLRRRR
jgi:G3E family GTPase